MRLTPPTNVTFGISLVAIVAGVLTSAEINLISGFSEYSFWILTGGAALLIFGVLFKKI